MSEHSDLLDWLLDQERTGNTGTYHLPPKLAGNTKQDRELREGIVFYSTGWGYRLRKNPDWRIAFREHFKYVDPIPEPEPRPKNVPVTAKDLDAAFEEFKQVIGDPDATPDFDVDAGYYAAFIPSWDDDKSPGHVVFAGGVDKRRGRNRRASRADALSAIRRKIALWQEIHKKESRNAST